MVLGLLVSAAVLFRVGLTDTLGALTFGGRVMGVVFLLAALVEAVAAAAVLDHWGKRATRYAGQCVLLGVVVVAVTSLMFLILQWEGGYRAGLFGLWVALVAWSGWALWEVSQDRVWQGFRTRRVSRPESPCRLSSVPRAWRTPPCTPRTSPRPRSPSWSPSGSRP